MIIRGGRESSGFARTAISNGGLNGTITNNRPQTIGFTWKTPQTPKCFLKENESNYVWCSLDPISVESGTTQFNQSQQRSVIYFHNRQMIVLFSLNQSDTNFKSVETTAKKLWTSCCTSLLVSFWLGSPKHKVSVFFFVHVFHASRCKIQTHECCDSRATIYRVCIVKCICHPLRVAPYCRLLGEFSANPLCCENF